MGATSLSWVDVSHGDLTWDGALHVGLLQRIDADGSQGATLGAMLAKLDAVLAAVDDAFCESQACPARGTTPNGTETPGTRIAHWIGGDDDYGQPTGGFTEFTLVRVHGTDAVLAVCEECHPLSIYRREDQ